MKEDIYTIVKAIPKGYVMTYGQIASLLGNKNLARYVGNALHNNPNPNEIPCYKVVNAKGKLSSSFAFGGLRGQIQRLENDGIEVSNDSIDLKRYQYKI